MRKGREDMTIRRERIAALLIVAIGSWSLGSAQAAGGRVHEEMGHQAWVRYLLGSPDFLPGLASFLSDDELWNAYYSGCIFPDWGYPGDINRDAGEDSHWGGFQEAYAEILRAKYPPPWSYESKRHIAFFLGAITHGVTDIPWHFNKGPEVAFENRGVTEDKVPHADLDTVCHLFAQAEHGTLPGLALNAWFPEDDLCDAFAKRGKQVTAGQLEAGRHVLTAARVGTVGFGSMAYWRNKMKYPWSHGHYEDYYYGGVQHGAALAAMWMRYWYAWFQGGACLQNMPDYNCQAPGYVAHAPCLDTTLDSATPNNNAGAEPRLALYRDAAGNERRILLRFALEGLPANTAVSQAILWLACSDATAGVPAENTVAGLYAVRRPWEAGRGLSNPVKGVSGRPAEGNEATWLAPWALPGCSGMGSDCDAAPAASIALHSPERVGDWCAWDVTDLVRQWVGKPESNAGMMLRLNEGSGQLEFYSSEAFKSREDDYCGGTCIERRPMLVVRTAP